MIEAAARVLFGDHVLVAGSTIDAHARCAHETERVAVERAVEKRRAEFATGRRLAHGLLDALGCPDVALLPGADRAPCWPDGVVGSIAHDARWCVVVVGRRAHHRSLGVDIEPAEPLEPELWDSILRADEREQVAERRHADRGLLARLAFSAKEAVYKALAPHVRTILEFHDVGLELAGVTLDADRPGELRATLLRGDLDFDPQERVAVRHVQRDGLLVTGVALPACGRAAAAGG